MDIAEYSNEVWKTDREHELVYYFLKLGSEAGEIQQDYANYLKGKIQFKELQDKVQLELGDLMWYWIIIHGKIGLIPSQTLDLNIKKLQERYAKN